MVRSQCTQTVWRLTLFLSFFFFPPPQNHFWLRASLVKENNIFKGDQIWSHEIATFCLGVVQATERWKGRAWEGGVVGEEDPAPSWSGKKVAPVLRAERAEPRGGGGGRRRRGEPSLARAAAGARGREPNSARRSPARGLRRSPTCAQCGLVPAPKLSLGKGGGRRATRTQAPPDRRGGRASVQPSSAEPGGRFSAARVRGALSRPGPDTPARVPPRGWTPKADKQ